MLGEFLWNSPFATIDLDLERDKDLGRELEPLSPDESTHPSPQATLQ